MKTLQEKLILIQEDKRRSEFNPYEIGALERYSAERYIRLQSIEEKTHHHRASRYDISAQTRRV